MTLGPVALRCCFGEPEAIWYSMGPRDFFRRNAVRVVN